MAGKFQYRLQKVLALRERREEDAKQELSAGERDRNRQQALFDDLKHKLTSAQKQMGQQLQGGQASAVQMSNEYIGSLEEKLKAQEKRLRMAQEGVDRLSAKVKLASRERFILEKHRDNSKAAWQAEENRLEALRLDEMAGQMYLARKRRDAENEAPSTLAWIEGMIAESEQGGDA